MADPGRLATYADAATLPLGLFFVAAGFVVAPEPVWAAMFYLVGVPLVLWRIGPAMAPALREPLVALPVLLILWLALALLWSAPAQSGPSRALWLWNCLCTLCFFLAAIRVAGPARDAGWLVITLIVAASVNAVWAIARYIAEGAVAERMAGWAETRQPILGAAIIGLCLLAALGRLAQARGPGRLALAAAVAVMAAFIWLTGSRGPLAATLAGAAVLAAGLGWRWLLAGAAAVVVAGLALWRLDPTVIGDLVGHMTDRGWSLRLEIWRQSLAMIAGAPILGHGLTALLPRTSDQFPHDLYLSTWLYGGAVGLALLLGTFALVARGLWRMPAGWERRTLGAMALAAALVGLTDLSQVVKGPGPMWYVIWLPLALSVAAIRRGAPR